MIYAHRYILLRIYRSWYNDSVVWRWGTILIRNSIIYDVLNLVLRPINFRHHEHSRE
jgi:hypothetical protein